MKKIFVLILTLIPTFLGFSQISSPPGVENIRSHSLVDAQRDSLMKSHKIIYMNGVPEQTAAHLDSVRKTIELFYIDQFHNFADPAAPYFLFLSRDASLAMGIGGCVRMRGWYDWGGAIPANGFSPYLIQMHPDPGNMKKFGTTPAGTCLFFRVIGRNKILGHYQLYIEANFNGYNNADFHLKKAYAILNEWTIGYAPSTFSDPSAIAPTVDASGPNNKISPTNVLVRWMHQFKTNWAVAASLETPSSHYNTMSGLNAKCSDWLPDVAAFLQYAWGKSEHIRLAGILRTLPYRDLKTGQNRNVIGWGTQLSAVGHPTRELSLFGTVCGGAGFESLGSDLQIGNYDLVANPDIPGKMFAPYALGWNVGVQYNFLSNLFASAQYSQCNYIPQKNVDSSDYRFGSYIAANIFWNLTPRIQTGIEYDWGIRKNRNGESRHAQRAGIMAQFSF